MGEQVGEIQYDEAASLKPGAPYEETETPVELALLYEVEDGSAEPNEETRKNRSNGRRRT